MNTSFLSFMMYIVKIILCVGQLWPALQYRNRGKLPPCIVHCSAKYGTLDFLVSCRIQNIGILYATQYGLYFRRKSYWRGKKWLSCFQIDMWYDTKCKTKYHYLMWKWHKMRIYFVVLIANKSFQEVHISGCKFKNCSFICLVWHSWDKFP